MIAKTLAAVTLAASLVACVQPTEPPQSLKTAIPTADQVQIKLPASNARTSRPCLRSVRHE
jgi:hypothetical protein